MSDNEEKKNLISNKVNNYNNIEEEEDINNFINNKNNLNDDLIDNEEEDEEYEEEENSEIDLALMKETEIKKEVEKKTIKIPEEKINNFKFTLTLFYFITTVQILIPQIVIISSKKSVDYYDLFHRFWWILIILLSIFLTIIITVYVLKKKFFRNLGGSIPLFIIYIFVILLIYTFISFYSIKMCFGICLIQFVVFGAILILEKIKILNDKPYFKLLIIYSLIIVGFVLFCIFGKTKIVNCFIYLIFLMMFCLYVIFEFKNMFISFVKDYNINFDKDLSLMLYAIGMMNSNVDILTCPFREEK